MLSKTVSVAGWSIDKKVDFVEFLWRHREPASYFANNFVTPPSKFDRVEAKKSIEDGFVDYVSGRCIKINTRNDDWNFTLFERDPTITGDSFNCLYDKFVQNH